MRTGGLEAMNRWYRGYGEVVWRLCRCDLEAVERWSRSCGDVVRRL